VPSSTALLLVCLSGPVRFVDVVVFLDENLNGALDASELGRVPGVGLSLDGVRGRTQPGSGRASLPDRSEGQRALVIDPETLPPFYEASPSVRRLAPGADHIAIAARLPVAANHPHTYLAFGDSLTEGVGSSDGAAWRRALEARLRAHFAVASVVDGGSSGTDSHRGARRIAALLEAHRPAYTLILYGTNDWEREDRGHVTARSLGRILERVSAAGSLAVLATLPPTQPGADPRASLERNHWVFRVNASIRRLAAERGAPLADVEAAFLSRADRASLYFDGLHPNDAGYALVAESFFAAISQRAGR
jgi:lysophospholipase L1-like esterase